MDMADTAFRLILAFALGAVLGLEREVNQKKLLVPGKQPSAVLGIRSFSLMTVFGAITGFIYLKYVPLALLITAAFFVILCLFYFLDSFHTKDHGLTAEIAALYSFIIGLLLATGIFPIQLTIAVTTIVILLLSQKDKIKHVVEDIRQSELNAFISYAILAVVIMPFLPNVSYSIADIGGLSQFLKNIGLSIGAVDRIDLFNPFKTWLILVLITGVDLISYILGRVIGEKSSWLLTSAIGGLVSSTATTQAIAKQSKGSGTHNYLIAAAVLSNLVSFFQIAILIGAINGQFLVALFPVVGLMTLAAVGLLVYFVKAGDAEKKIEVTRTVETHVKIIDLPGALKFAGMYLCISIISKVALVLFGKAGLLLTTGIGALIGLDAVMINTSQLAGVTIDYGVALIAFIIANSVNLVAKSIYAYIMGTKPFAVKFSSAMAAIIGASIIGLYI